MRIDAQDIEALLSGQPPLNLDLLRRMTLGRDRWLDWIRDYYLVNFIQEGGSKVKVLVGDAGSGKTHLLSAIGADASGLGYATVYLSAREYRLNDLPNLYRAIVQQIDIERILQGLCKKVAKDLGYSQHDTRQPLLPVLMEDQGMTRDLAMREIGKSRSRVFHQTEFSPSWLTFVYGVITCRLIQGSELGLHPLVGWLAGEKLTPQQKRETLLFERLQKINAREWLSSLVRLLRLAGIPGLVVAIDNLEILTERSEDTGRFRYTPNAAKDTCELIRQIIDDTEVLEHFFLLLAGRWPMLEDERRGFQSYEALWMRLQSGLVPVDRFNPLADILNADRHLSALGPEFPGQVQVHLQKLFQQAGLPWHRHASIDLEEHRPLRSRVMTAALSTLEGA